jgi:hypothetical protein
MALVLNENYKIIKNIEMRIKIKLKSFLLAFVIVGMITFITIYNNLNRVQLPKENLNFENEFFQVESTKWLINNRIAQYSARLIVDKDKVIIEALALTDYVNQEAAFQKQNIKFLVKYENKLFVMDVQGAFGNTTNFIFGKSCRHIWRFNTVIQNIFQNLDQIFYALTDYGEYLKLLNFVNRTDDLMAYFAFHKPVVYRTDSVKKKAIAHCLHYVRYLNENRGLERMLNWLEIQKNLGMDKIKAYFYRVDKNSYQTIRSAYGTDFLEIIDFKLHFVYLCQFQLYRLNRDVESSINSYLAKLCKKTFEVYFKKKDFALQTTMELFTTNDCFISYKYAYDYVSNYDFDELIFPRKHDRNSLEFLNSVSCENHDSFSIADYNLYDFMSRLEKNVSSMVKKPLGGIFFSHVIFFKDNNQDFFHQLANISNSDQNAIVSYKYNNLVKNFKVNPKESEKLIEKLLDTKEVVDCLDQKYALKTRLDSNWNRAYGMVSNKYGKTIFNTNNTIFINQHRDFLLEPNATFYELPLKFAFHSHYRENLKGHFTKRVIPLSYFILDLEAYLYLSNLF